VQVVPVAFAYMAQAVERRAVNSEGEGASPSVGAGENMQEITDVDLAEDVKELLAKNPDVHLADALKKIILEAKDDDLLMTTSNYEHGIEITKVVVLTPAIIALNLK
jgi:hypothetical protein